MFRRFIHNLRSFKLSMRWKLTLSLSAIAAILLISGIISVMEYSRMSTYVSDLIAANIKSINASQRLGQLSNDYNLGILAVVGDETSSRLPDFDQEAFAARCDSLRRSLTSVKLLPLADSVVYSYSAFMLTSLELQNVISSDFIDSRTWYFDRLQPRYNRLRRDIDVLSNAVYSDLQKNSLTFQQGFYRSIIPGIVATGVGLLMVVLLLFFLLSFYVRPVGKMLSGLRNYRSFNQKYTYSFDGDDELSELNDGITEIIGENQQMRVRVTDLRKKLNKE